MLKCHYGKNYVQTWPFFFKFFKDNNAVKTAFCMPLYLYFFSDCMKPIRRVEYK